MFGDGVESPEEVRLFRAPILGPSGGGGTREAGSTVVAEILVGRSSALSGEYAPDLARAEGSSTSTSQGSAETLGARIKGVNWEVPEGKADLCDHGLFSSYEGQQGAVNGQDSWSIFQGCGGL